MVKYAYVFPGQGAQAPGMAKDFADIPQVADLFKTISSIIGEDITDLLWNADAATLARSDRSQLAITAASLAAYKALEVKGITPSAVAGFSLGEWPSLYAAGILSLEDTLSIVKKRGEIMQKACENIAAKSEGGNAPGMAAVMGLGPEAVLAALAGRDDVFAVNMNSPVQTVIAGTDEGLAFAEGTLKEAGARRVLRLKVAGPFHSPLMVEAAREFEAVIENVTFNAPKIPFFSNVTGLLEDNPQEIKANCVKHIVSPVLWTTEEKGLFELMQKDGGEWKILEVGPGSVLSGLWGATEYKEKVSITACGTNEAVSAL